MYTYISVLVIVGASTGAEVESVKKKKKKNWVKAIDES